MSDVELAKPRSLNFDHTLALLSNLFDAARKESGDILLVTTLLDTINGVVINVQHELKRRNKWAGILCPNCLKPAKVWTEGPVIKWSCTVQGCAWENFDGTSSLV